VIILSRRQLAATGLLLLAGGPALAQAPVTIRVGGTPNYGPVLPVIAAQKLGLYAKAGVKVEFTGYPGGSASMEAIAADEADVVNYFPPGLALARNRGVKATILTAGTITPHGWKIMVKKGSPITDVKQLVGKKVGTSAAGSTTDFFALWVQAQSGGSFVRVPVGGAGLIPNLTSGNVDAIVAYPPLSYQVSNSGVGQVLLDLGEAMKPNMPDVWIGSDKAITGKREGVAKFLSAFYGAITYMQKNPDWSIKFLQDETKLDAAVAKQEFENTVMNLSSDGSFKEEWVEASLELGRLAGLKDLPPAKTLYTTDFIPVKPLLP
jgi:NitT/TauT family transport system substrate-binding protein